MSECTECINLDKGRHYIEAKCKDGMPINKNYMGLHQSFFKDCIGFIQKPNG